MFSRFISLLPPSLPPSITHSLPSPLTPCLTPSLLPSPPISPPSPTGKLSIDFITDSSKIDSSFVSRLFSLQRADMDELNLAYESTTKQILKKFKESFWLCVNIIEKNVKLNIANLNNSGSTTSSGVSIAAIPQIDVVGKLKENEEYVAFMDNKRLLLSQLAVSTHDKAEECCTFLEKFGDTLLLKACVGIGEWSSEWGEELR